MRGAHWTDIPPEVLAVLRRGAVLPAHPLALDENRQFDRVSQRALSRYYIDAGAGGLAVGVHATQFQISDVGLYRPVLELAAETAARLEQTAAGHDRRRDRQDRAGRRGGAHGARARLPRRAAGPRRAARAPARTSSSPIAPPLPGRCRPSASTCRRQSAALPSRAPSGPALRQSTTSSPSRLRPSTATRRWTWPSAWRPPAPRSASPSTPATTTTSSPTW